jgi:DNA-binding GntR family transcriptional regulator
MSATDIADRKDRNGTEEQFALDRPTGFKSLTAAVASALQNDLVTGRHLPGAKLPIVKLARDYGVSPGAVREALSRLVSENLVEFNEQRGFRAAPVSRAALFDIARTRVLIDAHALRDAIRLGDVDWEADVIAMQRRLADRPERDDQSRGMRADWQRLHRIFHRTLIAACGSEWLIRFHDLLYDQMIRYRSLAGAFQLDLRRNVRSEHAAIVDAVIARDADAAAAAIETHYMTTANLLVEVTALRDEQPA